MDELLEKMIEIAGAAAVEVLDIYSHPFSVDFKSPGDPVTEADRRANELICGRLMSAFPSIPIVAEESPPATWEEAKKAERVFFVDPVDGTREFVKKTGEFAVMIGLLEGTRPTKGVLHAPAQGIIWAGSVGDGAFRIDRLGVKTPLAPLRSRPLGEAIVVSSKSQKTEFNERALRLLAPGEIQPVGSAGLKGAAVADSRADLYIAPSFAGCLWDTCAPEALVRAVGGVFTDARGNELDYRAAGVENNRGAVACARELHTEVIDRISSLFR
jgi:3'(2'), 5'-bisphosphate nucleotidase